MTGALERCVGDVRRFTEEHWEQAPLLHRGERDAFDSLLALGDVDHLVTETLLRMPAFRMVKDGKPVDPSTYTQTIRIGGKAVDRTARPDRVADAFADGATIVLQALHRQSGPVGGFCRELEIQLTHPVQANAYITPPGSQGFAVHHDTHDVFVLQTHGRKAWRVYRPVVELAGPDQAWKPSLGDPGEPMLEAELEQGNVLYIPRGFPHAAEARAGISAHITVGILTSTWLDVWRRILRRLSEERSFREALPVGFADHADALAAEVEVRRKDLHEWIDRELTPESIREFADRFWRTRRPAASGRLTASERDGRIGAATPVRCRRDCVFRVDVRGQRATVVLGLRELRMPAFCGEALRFIAARRSAFVPRDVPGLDQASSVVLVRRLVREGALEVVGGST